MPNRKGAAAGRLAPPTQTAKRKTGNPILARARALRKADALLSRLEGLMVAEVGGMDDINFVPDMPAGVCDRSGGIDATAPEYLAVATVAYLRWLREEWAARQRRADIARRRAGFHLVVTPEEGEEWPR